MSIAQSFYRSLFRAAALSLPLFFASCGTAPVAPPSDTPDEFVYVPLSEIPDLLARSRMEDTDKNAEMRLQAVTSLIEYGEYDWARTVLQGILPNTLLDPHYLLYNLLGAKLALAEGRPFRARRFLWDRRFYDTLPDADLNTQIDAFELRASLLSDIAEYRDSIKERIHLDTLLLADPELQDLNQDLLWQTLMELSSKDLSMESHIQNEPILKGWYHLAALSKNNQTNIRLQLEEVDNWVSRWPNHPASARLPADLQLLKQLVENQAKKVALLLPLSGKREKPAKAIRDGFMAGWYNASRYGDAVPEVAFYDSNVDDINAIYDRAVSEGAEIVVGPLDKARIGDLSLRPLLEVPVLGLNYIDEIPALALDNMYQFGLAPEDDARQIAQRAWRDGHRRALILAANSEWGDRGMEAFAIEWLALGGELVGDYRYAQPKNFSKLIAEALDILDSTQRRRRVRSILGQIDVQFEPRRREDIDLIFLMANARNARQLKPALAFHYAGDIPVYATSHVYKGEINPERNKDMNQIRFVSLPWFFDSQLPEKHDIFSYSNNSAWQDLYALGVDAFHLFPRLEQLKTMNQAHYYGTTGTLSIDAQQRVVREQIWAQFIGGRAVIMPTAAREE